MSSYVFSPSVGGIETVSELLAPEFTRAGHEVVLVTGTQSDDGVSRPYRVERRAGPRRMIELLRWCDVYFQNNISLLFAWPLLFVRRPWIVAHHTWLGEGPNRRNWKARIKRSFLPRAANATISQAVANDIAVPSTVVGNPYSTALFKAHPEISRDQELVFLGRLVTDKGVDLLIEALAGLRDCGLKPRLLIIGSGSEEESLRAQVRARKLEAQVEFAGARKPAEIARLLCAHQILVVPSRWAEPFGLVALEGIACGCVVVAAKLGGLPDAVGPCGLLFRSGDVPELTSALQKLLTNPDLRAGLLQDAPRHLLHFEPSAVAARYLKIFEDNVIHPGKAVPCR